MATIDQLKQALINADKAGDTASATKLAQAIRAQQQTQAQPEPAAPTTPEEPGMLAKIGDVFTGNLREVPETEAMPDWGAMPEINQLTNAPGWKAAIGTLMSSPAESVQVIQSNFPGVQVRQDEKGNFIMTSSIDGKDYAIKPGFQMSDIPRAGSAIAAFTPAGRIPSILGAGAASAGTQAIIEGTQAATGGEFSPAEVITSGITGAAMPAVTKLVQGLRAPVAAAAGQADNVPVMMQGVQQADNIPAGIAAPSPAAAIPTAAESASYGALAKKAAEGGMGSVKAKEDLARMAAINPEAKAAAEAVGIDLPPDVLSDSRLLQETAGLTRSIKASEASTAWSNTIEAARARADEVMAQLDASPDIATVSETVKQSLGKTRTDLEKSARMIYDQIDGAMPKQTKVNLRSTQSALSEIIDEVGEANLSAAEKRLYALATNPDTTYGALLREKSQIGAAMSGKVDANPYGSVETGALKRLYGALADDQLGVVETAIGKEARDNLRYANQLVAKRKGLEDRIVNAFGKEGEGSIATKLTSAIKTGAKGDITQLNKLVKTVPPELRKEALSSALMAQARTPKGDFSFGAFESMYQGLRKNAPVYAAISKEIGPEGSELLRSLYVVSKRINMAENQVLKTGKANQALLGSIAAEGLIKRMMQSTAGNVASGAARVIPGAGGLADLAKDAMTKGKTESVNAVGKLLASPDFAQLIADVAERGAEKAAVRKLVITPAFAKWANRSGIPAGITAREKWVRTALLSGKQFNEEQK